MSHFKSLVIRCGNISHKYVTLPLKKGLPLRLPLLIYEGVNKVTICQCAQQQNGNH